MNLHKQTIDSRRYTCTRQMWNVFRLAAGTLALSTGELQTVRHIKHDRTTKTPHDGKAAEIHDEIVIAKRSATFGEQYAVIARLVHLLYDVFHLPWSKELPLLHVHDLARFGSCKDEIRLPAEERRDLENVEDFTRSFTMRRLMDVREDGQPEFFTDVSENLETFFDAESAKRLDGSAIRFVVRRFENERNLTGSRDLL